MVGIDDWDCDEVEAMDEFGHDLAVRVGHDRHGIGEHHGVETLPRPGEHQVSERDDAFEYPAAVRHVAVGEVRTEFIVEDAKGLDRLARGHCLLYTSDA